MGCVEPLPGMLALLQPPVSYVIFGGAGGVLYVLRQRLRGHEVRGIELLARPVFGAVAAFILTVTLGLPNHLTSLVAGYFGIDVWDVAADIVNRKFDRRLPMSFKHAPPPPPPRQDEEPDTPM